MKYAKYVNDAGLGFSDAPVSTTVGVLGALSATLAVLRHVKFESSLLQALALATAGMTGFAASYAGARLVDRGMTLARGSSFFNRHVAKSNPQADVDSDQEVERTPSPAPSPAKP